MRYTEGQIVTDKTTGEEWIVVFQDNTTRDVTLRRRMVVPVDIMDEEFE